MSRLRRELEPKTRAGGVSPKRSARGLTRRGLLAGLLGAGSVGWAEGLLPLAALAKGPPAPAALAGAHLLGFLPFLGEGSKPVGRPFGSGLAGRRIFDLSTLDPGRLVVPRNRFYLRTRFPDRLERTSPWSIGVVGLGESPVRVPLRALREEEEPQGVHLMECAGNEDDFRFGLIGAAAWTGVPLARLLRHWSLPAGRNALMVTGFDEHSAPTFESVPGASWVFPLDQLLGAGAFLATRMNGAPLTFDHGYPVRLLVPGWYGCVSIKWVTGLAFVGDDEPATGQMREFAERTHQDGIPALAHEFAPAVVDAAAMPVRIERWRRGEASICRVVGILWGATQGVEGLAIRFRQDEPFQPVDAFDPPSSRTWSLWWHLWRPPGPGRYSIDLEVLPASLRTRRLDQGHYRRTFAVPAG